MSRWSATVGRMIVAIHAPARVDVLSSVEGRGEMTATTRPVTRRSLVADHGPFGPPGRRVGTVVGLHLAVLVGGRDDQAELFQP